MAQQLCQREYKTYARKKGRNIEFRVVRRHGGLRIPVVEQFHQWSERSQDQDKTGCELVEAARHWIKTSRPAPPVQTRPTHRSAGAQSSAGVSGNWC